MSEQPHLSVDNLSIQFPTEGGRFLAVDNVNFDVYKGETVCIVGESGCGKSMTALSIMGLVPLPGEISTGHIYLNNDDLLSLNNKEMLKIRGNDISMVFQEPMTSLNPVFTIGKQIAEVILNHQNKSKAEAGKIAVEMLRRVGITDPERRAKEYPHELSGGMRQRVMIAMALACNPELLIADEPTTALDVTIQAQILDLMREIKQSYGTSIILITHDLGVVADMADRVIVMYAGSIVEVADIFSLFKNPSHPYTEGLLKSIPRIETETKYLSVTKGTVPSPDNMPKGCKFYTRCSYAQEKCEKERPPLKEVSEGHQAACWYANELSLEGVDTGEQSI